MLIYQSHNLPVMTLVMKVSDPISCPYCTYVVYNLYSKNPLSLSLNTDIYIYLSLTQIVLMIQF